MQKSHYQDVLEFHQKFEVPLPSTPTLLKGDVLRFRLGFLQEELNELEKAHEDESLEDALDALVDMWVVLCGTIQFLGISEECFEEAWREVHRANLSKERCKDASESKRGSALDIRKPHNFVPPDHAPIIRKYKR